MHAAVSASDQAFANAVADLAGVERPDYPNTPEGTVDASTFWNQRLEQACGFESSYAGRRTNLQLYK